MRRRAGAGDYGPDEVHGGDSEDPDDYHEDAIEALLDTAGGASCRAGELRELGVADLDVRGDGVQVVVVAVEVGLRVVVGAEEVSAKAADAEDGDDRRGEWGAVVGVVARVGVGVARVGGDEEGVARTRGGDWGGYEYGRRGDHEDEQEDAVGHGGDGVEQREEAANWRLLIS